MRAFSFYSFFLFEYNTSCASFLLCVLPDCFSLSSYEYERRRHNCRLFRLKTTDSLFIVRRSSTLPRMKRLLARRLLRAALSSTPQERQRHLTIGNNHINVFAPSRRSKRAGIPPSSAASFFTDDGKRNSLAPEETTTTTTTTTMKQPQSKHQQYDNHLLAKKTSAEASADRTRYDEEEDEDGEEEEDEMEDEEEEEEEEDEKIIKEGLREAKVLTQEENRFIDVDNVRTKSSDDPYRVEHLYYTLERLQYQFPLHFRHPVSKHWELVDKTFKVTEEYSKLRPPRRKHGWLNSVSILSRLALHENGYRNHIIFDEPPWGAEKQSHFQTKVKFKVCAAHAVTYILCFFLCPAIFFETEILLRPEGVDGFPQMQNLAKVLNETFPSVFQNGLTEFFAGVAAVPTYAFRKQTEKVYLTFASFSASFRNADAMKRILQTKL